MQKEGLDLKEGRARRQVEVLGSVRACGALTEAVRQGSRHELEQDSVVLRSLAIIALTRQLREIPKEGEEATKNENQ